MVVWNKALALVLLMCPVSVVSTDLTHKDKAQFGLMRLQPRLVAADAGKIYTAAYENTCGLPWQVLAAIAFVESSLIKNSVGRLNKTTDFGLMQINEKTVGRYSFDKHKLMTSEAYAMWAASIVLRDLYSISRGTFKYWLGMYRFGTNKRRFYSRMKFYHDNVVRVAKQLGLSDSRLMCQ